MIKMTPTGKPNLDFKELKILGGDTFWASLHIGILVTSTWEPRNYTSGFITKDLDSYVE